MGWSGIEAIRMLPGETAEDAVDRAYSDGSIVTTGDDGKPVLLHNGGPERDHTLVSPEERQWMLDAAAIIDEVRPGWELLSEDTREGDDWPWNQSFVQDDVQMFIEIDTTAVTFKWVRGNDDPTGTWDLWWRMLQRFAEYPCAIFHPDEDERIDMSLSAEEVDAEHWWFS